MKRIFLIFLSAFIYICCFSQTNNSIISKETYTYSIKNQDTLKLDKYSSLSENKLPKACILFLFGGGFSSGSKDMPDNVNFMRKLVEKGYVAIAINYRLGMKNIQGTEIMDIATSLVNAISMTVEDLYEATSFVYEKAEIWNINKNQIIACGSSAGAVGVLQGEYLICSDNDIKRKLPESFRYGGIISFAGAILKPTEKKELIYNPSPVLMFHGDADSNVPYNKLELGPIGLYGSNYLANLFNEINSPYYFYQVNNAGHEIAGIPMKENLNEIDSFIQKMVIDKQKLQIHTIVNEIGKPEKNKDFDIMDYIRSNYSY